MDDHVASNHYATMFGLCLMIVLAAVLGATSLGGARLTAWIAGVSAVGLGVASTAHPPEQPSALGRGWAIALVAWGVVYVLVAMRRWAIPGHAAAAVVAALALLSGCGPDGASPPAAQGPAPAAAVKNPCDLVTAAELSALVHADVTQPTAKGEFQGRECTWADITVAAWHGQEFYTPHAVEGFTAVPGIGDEAHVGPGMFMFRKGDDVFAINPVEWGPEIAKLILPRL
jgi:hypothetical protein